jgi:hypothetical protein
VLFSEKESRARMENETRVLGKSSGFTCFESFARIKVILRTDSIM